jgi:D-serine deaminase-like pyridoxal phosphate-dependent protein
MSCCILTLRVLSIVDSYDTPRKPLFPPRGARSEETHTMEHRAETRTTVQIGLPRDRIETPALLLDLDRFDRNITRLSSSLRDLGVAWRPHTKAHKSPELAQRQIAVGAIGVTCAKVGEAEVMVEHGIPSVLVANELAARSKADRVARLQEHAEVIICADDPFHVDLASQAAVAAGATIPMLVDVNVGMERTGVAPGKPAVELARRIDRAPGLRFAGLMAYEGQVLTLWPFEEKRAAAEASIGQLIETVRMVEADGLPVEIVSGGGSGSYQVTARIPGMTEIQAGGAALMDLFYADECHLAEEGYEFALTVLSTVTSRPTPDRVIIDAGFKALSHREGVYPRVIDQPGLDWVYLSAEHGRLTASGSAQRIAIGDRLEFIPDYSDTTTFRHDAFIGIRDGRVERIIPLLGRGRLT